MNDLLLAQAVADGPPTFSPLLPLGAILVVWYVLVLRPQQKREREKEIFRENLKKNDEVVTTAGFHGRVIEAKGGVVSLELAPNVRVKIERRCIDGPPVRPETKDSKETKEAKEQTK